MRHLLPLLALVATLLTASAAVVPPTSVPAPQASASSKSGQFVAVGPSFAITLSTARNSDASTNLVRQSPMELVMTAERVKVAVLRQLGVQDAWESTARFVINPQLPADGAIRISAVRFSNGWSYEVQLPVLTDRTKLVRSIVQVVMQEITQRGGAPATQIPDWLIDGMVALVLSDSVGDLVMEANPVNRTGSSQMWVVEGAVKTQIRTDPLSAIRGRLKGRTLPSFWDITQGATPVRDTDARLIHEACSQILVVELMKLEGGQAAMMKTLRELPRFLNWQLALLSGYSAHFKTMLDVEKWWSLVSINIGNQDQYAKWTVDVALTKLDEILRPSVALKDGASNVPGTVPLPLQQLIGELDYESQRGVLRQVVSRLNTLQWNVTPDLWRLVQDYQMVIETYLHRRGKQTGNSRTLVRQTAADLDLLDVLRNDFKRFGNGTPATASKP